MAPRKLPRVTVIDFETEAIEQRPVYPPRPVGVSIMRPGRKPRYYAWGHPCENNCDQDTARKALQEVWDSGDAVLCHNAKFDLDVAETHLQLAPLPWERVHDTLFLLFLDDPHASSFSLKPSAARLLNLPPEEQEAVRDWLYDNKVIPRTKKSWGGYICKAPGKLVGRYADGDVTRTLQLFSLLYPRVLDAGMGAAYDRERRLLRVLLKNERQGILVDATGLERDIQLYEQCREVADRWLRKTLRRPDLNLDSNDELADALDAAGIVTEWAPTATGKRSTAKKNMTADRFDGALGHKVFTTLGYRGRINTCVGTFMKPWLDMATHSGGRIFTSWNQVRNNNSGKDQTGTRTGRLSSAPNFQNIPKTFYDKNDGYAHPAHIRQLVELPLMRRYVLPDPGCLFGHRDYSQQELRILAHFEDGALLEAYRSNPDLDVHDFVRDEIARIVSMQLERRAVKVLNFGMIYGMGLNGLAHDMGVAVESARTIKNAQRRALPGLDALEKDIRRMGKEGQPIRTWGGRLYYVEEPKLIDGKMRSFEYKLLNYLIQGSAADCTKEALIRYDEAPKESRFMVTVHDEINAAMPKRAVKKEMAILRDVMSSVEFDVPMKSDGKIGACWGALEKYKE